MNVNVTVTRPFVRHYIIAKNGVKVWQKVTFTGQKWKIHCNFDQRFCTVTDPSLSRFIYFLRTKRNIAKIETDLSLSFFYYKLPIAFCSIRKDQGLERFGKLKQDSILLCLATLWSWLIMQVIERYSLFFLQNILDN